jgi:hypothetical protein
VAKTVAGADIAITIKFKIQFINDGIHQLARRFAKDSVGWFELLAFAEKLKWQDHAWHILCHIGSRLPRTSISRQSSIPAARQQSRRSS